MPERYEGPVFGSGKGEGDPDDLLSRFGPGHGRSREQMESDANARRNQARIQARQRRFRVAYENERNRTAYEKEQSRQSALGRLQANAQRMSAAGLKPTAQGPRPIAPAPTAPAPMAPKPAAPAPAVKPYVPLQERGPLPGAANGVFVLGFGLVAVALFRPWILPLVNRAYHGTSTPKDALFTSPTSGTISLILFVLALVFIASLSPDLAQLVFFFLIGLWAVFLVMRPAVVQSALSWISQGAWSTQSNANSPPVTDTTPGQKGPR